MPYSDDLYYFVWQGSESAGQPLVLLHGAGGTYLFWPPQVRRLTGLTVLAPDLPGHGKSGAGGRRTIAAYAESILKWLDRMGISRAYLGGHSMGSAIALQLALSVPQRIAGLILIGAGARLKVHPDILQMAASEDTFMDAVARVVSQAFAEQTPTRLKALGEKRMALTSRDILYGDFLACNDFDVMGRLVEIRQPTLVICGAQDRLTPVRYARYLADQLPDARLQVVEESGHMVMLEKPFLVARLIQEFLQSEIESNAASSS